MDRTTSYTEPFWNLDVSQNLSTNSFGAAQDLDPFLSFVSVHR